jgi:hypothetical protein
VTEAERLVEAVMGLRTEAEVEEVVHQVMRARYPFELDEGDEKVPVREGSPPPAY